MTISFGRKALLGTAAAALVAGSIAGSAKAAVRFDNVADRPVIFTMRCAGSSEIYRWTVDEDHTLAVICNNGAPRAVVRLYTSDGSIVSRVVFDGSTYRVGFDNFGDAMISQAAR